MTEIVFPAIRRKSKRTQQKMIERFNATVLLNEFPDGAKVMTLDPIRGNKLTPRYEGPYTVVNKSSHGSYILKDGTGAILARHYAPSQLKLVLDDFEDTDTYEVETIIDHRQNASSPHEYEYLVKWKNYPHDLNTWEPEEHFIERQCITEYWANHHASKIVNASPKRPHNSLSEPVDSVQNVSPTSDDHTSVRKTSRPKRRRMRR
ncbi:hypothetical protein BX616_008766 [Lobosporangium transversale]|nr:hypothetical protein BX616_008766 [Lobosporangium transversale]